MALDEVKQALAADPTFGEAYNLRGLIYARLNDDALAEESFRRALQLNPRDADAHAQLRLVPVPAEALRRGRRAVRRRRWPARSTADAPRTLLAQGVCQARAGQLAEAERTLARVLRARRRPTRSTGVQPGRGAVPARRAASGRASTSGASTTAGAGQRADAVAGRAHRAPPGQPARACDELGEQLRDALPAVARGGGVRTRAASMSEAPDQAPPAPPARVHAPAALLRQARAGAGPAHRRAGRRRSRCRRASSRRSRPTASTSCPTRPSPARWRRRVCRTLKIDPAPVLALLPQAARPPARAGRRGPQRAVPRAPGHAPEPATGRCSARPAVLGAAAAAGARRRRLLACRAGTADACPRAAGVGSRAVVGRPACAAAAGRRRRCRRRRPRPPPAAAPRAAGVAPSPRRCTRRRRGRGRRGQRRRGAGRRPAGVAAAARQRPSPGSRCSTRSGAVAAVARCCSRARRSALDGALPLRVTIGNAGGHAAVVPRQAGRPGRLSTRDNVARLELK